MTTDTWNKSMKWRQCMSLSDYQGPARNEVVRNLSVGWKVRGRSQSWKAVLGVDSQSCPLSLLFFYFSVFLFYLLMFWHMRFWLLLNENLNLLNSNRFSMASFYTDRDCFINMFCCSFYMFLFSLGASEWSLTLDVWLKRGC